MYDAIEELVAENERLQKQVAYLKDFIKSLKQQLSEAKSDLVVQKAQERGRP
jgi:cell division septum initiation protein DivIVA